MNKVIETVGSREVSSAATPETLLELAISKGADIDQLEKLMALQERYDAKKAKSSFYQAMTQFQSLVPRIVKNKNGHNYKYAPLSDISEQIQESLSSCGLSYRFEQNHSELIEVTCIVTHVDGHSERTTMNAKPDTAGQIKGVQAIGSSVTYLQRYTLTSSLGITTADDDIDGRLPEQSIKLITNEQALKLDSMLDECNEEIDKFKGRFLKWWKIQDVSEIHAKNYELAITTIHEKFESQKGTKK